MIYKVPVEVCVKWQEVSLYNTENILVSMNCI